MSSTLFWMFPNVTQLIHENDHAASGAISKKKGNDKKKQYLMLSKRIKEKKKWPTGQLLLREFSTVHLCVYIYKSIQHLKHFSYVCTLSCFISIRKHSVWKKKRMSGTDLPIRG